MDTENPTRIEKNLNLAYIPVPLIPEEKLSRANYASWLLSLEDNETFKG